MKIAWDAGFVTWVTVDRRLCDRTTLPPSRRFSRISLSIPCIADSGYESEENYTKLA